MLIVRFEHAVGVVLAGVYGGGGGAVYLGIGGGGYGSTTSNTSVALTDCTMSNNTAPGLCLARHLLIQADVCV